MSEVNLKMVNGSLKRYLDDMLMIQKIKTETRKKMTPLQEKQLKALEKPTADADEVRDEIYTFIESNKTVFEKIRNIKSDFGVFGLIRCAGKIILKGEEPDIVKALKKSKVKGKTRYIRVRHEINKNALLEDFRRGKLKPEQITQLKELGIDIFSGDIPFIRPNIPNTPSIEEQEQHFKEAA